MPHIAKVWFMALNASKACRPLRPTRVGNMLLRCRNNLRVWCRMQGISKTARAAWKCLTSLRLSHRPLHRCGVCLTCCVHPVVSSAGLGVLLCTLHCLLHVCCWRHRCLLSRCTCCCCYCLLWLQTGTAAPTV